MTKCCAGIYTNTNIDCCPYRLLCQDKGYKVMRLFCLLHRISLLHLACCALLCLLPSDCKRTVHDFRHGHARRHQQPEYAINAAAPLRSFTFDFCATDRAVHIKRYATLLPSANDPSKGKFSFSGLPFGKYNVSVSQLKWLQSTALNVDATAGDADAGNIFLPGGDADGNNLVDIGDFGILVNAYGGDAGIPGSGYDQRADFNGDGTVDIADFGSLVNTYGTSGDTFATNLKATTSALNITLTWDGSFYAMGYRLYRGTSPGLEVAYPCEQQRHCRHHVHRYQCDPRHRPTIISCGL